MSTTDELLEEMLEDVEEYATPVADDDLQFWIDEHLRVISIPKNGVVAGVEGDKNVNKIKFGMNRYYHCFDMSTFSGRILYSNAKGNKNYYNITDMQASGSAITFSWLVDADAVQYMGKTAFVVYLYKPQGSELRQKFYSTLATLKVLEGMEVDSAVPVEKQTDIIERMKEEISAYAEEVKKSLPADYTAMTEQVSSLKVLKVDKPLTTDDGKIPRAKSGNVEWVEVGQPTDEQTNSAVTNWLNEHPEATTTVYDGAINEKKINANFLLWIKKDYVTPEMFGAQGDGIKDDSDAFQKCIDSGKPINLLPSKEYLIKKTIKIIDRVNFAVEGNYSKINFSCDYLFEICNSNNFLINNVLLICNGNNGFKFTTRTGTDRCGKTLFKNVSFVGCLIGFEINAPCGYNYFENMHFHKTLDNSVGFVIGEKIDESFTVYPNYIYIDKVTFDGESAGSNKTGIKLFYGTFVYISECDFCNIVNGCAIEICNDKYMHTISIQKNSFFNNSCSLLFKNGHSLDGVLINNNNFYLRNSDVILNRGSEDCYTIGSLSFSENTITGTSDAAVWFEMKKIVHFVCLGNNFGRDLTPVYRHCDIVCLRENMILDNPVHRFLDFTDNAPKTINCGGKYYMTEFRWGVFSDKKFSLSTTYDDDGDMIATITPVDNSGFMRCFLVPAMN